MATETFGPSALATPANAVTAARLLMAPILVALIVVFGPSWWTAGAWVVMAGTDWVDGWMARRQGTTRSGAFLDPLADKFLVLGAMGALVARGQLWWLPVVLIGGREVGMSLYRAWAGRRGVSVPARGWAKVKTWAQAVAIGLALVPPVAVHSRPAVLAVLWLAVVLTLWTGGLYLLAVRRGRHEEKVPGPSRPAEAGTALVTGPLTVGEG